MDKDSLARISSTLENLPALGDWNRENAIAAAASFQGDISKWDVSGVQPIPRFDVDISKWDVSGVERVSTPGFETKIAPVDSFDKDISHWKLPNQPAVLQIDGVKTFSSPEYVTTAKYAQRTYGLSDDKLMDMYRDYKDDYDNPGASDSPSFG